MEEMVAYLSATALCLNQLVSHIKPPEGEMCGYRWKCHHMQRLAIGRSQHARNIEVQGQPYVYHYRFPLSCYIGSINLHSFTDLISFIIPIQK